MAVTINADNGVVSGSAGLKTTPDASGQLDLQTNGTTAVSITSSGQDVVGTIAVKDATLSGSAAISSSISNTIDASRYGILNISNVTNATLTADRSSYGIRNECNATYQNAAAFTLNQYGAYNLAQTTTTAGNSINGEGALYGSYNISVNASDDATYYRVENAYGGYNYVTSNGDTSLIDQAYGSYNRVATAGTAASATVAITTAYGAYTTVQAAIANRNITTAYGYYLAATETGTITTKYGLYMNPAWANYIAGGLQIGGTASSANTSGLTLGTSNMAVPDGSAPLYSCRAWVNFNGTAAGTFAGGASTVTRVAGSTTATITTTTAHGLITGNYVYALTGVVAGSYVVTVLTATTFTITTVATTALTAVSITFAVNSIRGSGNVSSVADNGVGDYTVNFTVVMPDINYAVSVGTGNLGGTALTRIAEITSQTAGGFRVTQWNGASASTATDSASMNFSVFR